VATDAERRLVLIGKVTRPHGVRGEMKVLPGEGCSGAWCQVREVWLGKDARTARARVLRRARPGGRGFILSLEGVDSVEAAEELRDVSLFVERAALPPPAKGEWYLEDLIGLRVEDPHGRVLGELQAIFDNGAHEVYVVARAGAEILVPGVEGVVLAIEPEAGRVVLDPPPGLPGLE
jgi:16S rRNA processing protein RimM